VATLPPTGEPELGNTSAGRRTVCDTVPLESFQRLFYFDCAEIKKE
jgi:hypothetical protein